MNNKGFTLLEVIITVGILGILMSGVAVIFPQWMNQYVMLKETVAATEIMDVVASGVQDEMSMSQERTWAADGLKYVNDERNCTIPLNNTECSVSYADGKLIVEGQPQIYGAVFDKTFYKDMSVTLTLSEKKRSRDNTTFLVMTVQVYSSKGNLLCSETKNTFYYNPQP